ncbi:hypothetical protein PIB30_070695, partial [Stylosanthes scabra]|nr:hypothetical protein [Stylosanthes scabra]
LPNPAPIEVLIPSKPSPSKPKITLPNRIHLRTRRLPTTTPIRMWNDRKRNTTKDI